MAKIEDDVQALVAADDIEWPVQEALDSGVSVEELKLRLGAAASWCKDLAHHCVKKEGRAPEFSDR